jgi:FkbM family methyltransferase
MNNEQDQITPNEFLSIISNNFKESDIEHIMEIGALNCADSLIFKDKFPKAKVYCIEGLKDNFDTYLSNLKGILPINIIITNYDGLINFHKKNVNGLHSIYNRGELYGNQILENLECKTFKTLCEELKIPNVDVVKIDVEGATYEVLIGMGDMIHTIKIMHIETESYPFFEGQKLHNEVHDFLIEKGFTMIKITNARIQQNMCQHDSVWINNNFIKK